MNIHERQSKTVKKWWWVVATCVFVRIWECLELHSNKKSIRKQLRLKIIHSLPLLIYLWKLSPLSMHMSFWFSVNNQEIPMHNGPFSPLCAIFHSFLKYSLNLENNRWHLSMYECALWPFIGKRGGKSSHSSNFANFNVFTRSMVSIFHIIKFIGVHT